VLLVVALLVVLTGLAVAGLQLAGPGRTGATPPSPAPRPSPAGPPERPALLADLDDSAPAPTEAGLAAVVSAALADPALGGRLSVSVLDAATGKPLLEREAGTPLLPASTAKIATAVAVLTAVDPADRLTTRVLAGPVPGEVVLVGGGDPTLAAPHPDGTPAAGYPPPAQLADLAAQVRSGSVGRPVTRVLVDESLYSGERIGPGWRPTYVSQGAVAPVVPLMLDGGRVRPDRLARSAEPGLAAGAALGALLQPGAPVRSPAGPRRRTRPSSAPCRARRSASWSSRCCSAATTTWPRRWPARSRWRPAGPRPSRVRRRRCRRCSRRRCRPPGASPDAVALVDGSGLSRLNRLQPAAVSRLLARAAADDGSADVERLQPVLSGLPVGGFSGTLEDRYRESAAALPAAGVLRAKTGTLEGVSALAGLLRTADGRLLAFDLTADAVPPGANRQAEAALDALAGALRAAAAAEADATAASSGPGRVPGVPWRGCRADRPAPSTTTSRSPPRAGCARRRRR
jgi:D-alanyl-D-alanine carboxypeptidase/D-alanyl-D-alanine-endopeptidase (penicillin-binding protein 4)